jgi:hypothetical protein
MKITFTNPIDTPRFVTVKLKDELSPDGTVMSLYRVTKDAPLEIDANDLALGEIKLV